MKIFSLFCCLIISAGLSHSARAAETYKVDPLHSFALFRSHHAGAGMVWGRFNDPTGTLVLDDADPSKDRFSGEIQVGNIDTHNAKRDSDLKSPDFFNARQYPTITFKSTSVKKGEGNMLEVTGSLMIHGITKTVTVPIELTGKGQFPRGMQRAGIEATFQVKMSDFQIKGMPGVVGDEIKVIVALEGVKQ